MWYVKFKEQQVGYWNNWNLIVIKKNIVHE